MASLDPNSINEIEVAGIRFCVRELKSSGRKDVCKALKAIAGVTGIDGLTEMIDISSACILRHVASWDRSEPLTVSAIEDALDIKDLIELLRTMAFTGMLSVEDKKKSEPQHSCNEGDCVKDASEASACVGQSCLPSSVLNATDLDAQIASQVTSTLNVPGNSVQHSMTKSI